MDEYNDVIYHKPRSDVLHKVRIYWNREIIRSACGMNLDFSDSSVMEEEEFNENFIHWLQSRGTKVYALCYHCCNREIY